MWPLAAALDREYARVKTASAELERPAYLVPLGGCEAEDVVIVDNDLAQAARDTEVAELTIGSRLVKISPYSGSGS